MIDLLLSLAFVLLLVALGAVLLLLLTVAPFVLAVDMAERRGFSAGRWGLLSLLAIGAALALGLLLRDGSLPLLLPLVVLAWAGPAVLSLMHPGQQGVGGRQGLHEA